MQMKEQISVDESDFEELRTYLAESGLSIYDTFNEIITDYKEMQFKSLQLSTHLKRLQGYHMELIKELSIKDDEINRLKRLDENVKEKMAYFKDLESRNDLTEYSYAQLKLLVKLLESLDK
jgi:hypothetical protein